MKFFDGAIYKVSTKVAIWVSNFLKIFKEQDIYSLTLTSEKAFDFV